MKRFLMTLIILSPFISYAEQQVASTLQVVESYEELGTWRKGKAIIELYSNGRKISFEEAAKMKKPLIQHGSKYADTGRKMHLDRGRQTFGTQRDFKAFLDELKDFNGSDVSNIDNPSHHLRSIFRKHNAMALDAIEAPQYREVT